MRLLINAVSVPRNTTRPSQLKEHGTQKSLFRGTKNRSDLTRGVPISRAAMFVLSCAATDIDSARQSTEHASHGSRVQSIPGLEEAKMLVITKIILNLMKHNDY